MKVRELLTRETWTQNAWAKDKAGNGVHEDDPKAVSFCLLSAITVCYPNPNEAQHVRDKIYPRIDNSGIFFWNDTHEWHEVETLIKGLDI